MTATLLSGFDKARITGALPQLPGAYAVIPDADIHSFPHYGGKGCAAIGVTPEDVRQNLQNSGRLAQLLQAVHPTKDSKPYQDANASAPTDRCDGAGCRSNRQENRSQDDSDHLAAGCFQGCICRVHAIHLKAPFRWHGFVLTGDEIGHRRGQRAQG